MGIWNLMKKYLSVWKCLMIWFKVEQTCDNNNKDIIKC